MHLGLLEYLILQTKVQRYYKPNLIAIQSIIVLRVVQTCIGWEGVERCAYSCLPCKWLTMELAGGLKGTILMSTKLSIQGLMAGVLKHIVE